MKLFGWLAAIAALVFWPMLALADDPPSVASLSVHGGPGAGGTVVVIAGHNFTGSTDVTWERTDGSLSRSAAGFSVDSDTQITATSPPGGGYKLVHVHTAAGVSADFTPGGGSPVNEFIYDKPVITSIDPAYWVDGSSALVSIHGINLTEAATVTFAGTDVSGNVVGTVVSDSEISIEPANLYPYYGPVGVTVRGSRDDSNTATMTYVHAIPVVTSLSTNQGATKGGYSLVVHGSGFTGAYSITIGGTEAYDRTIDSDTQITINHVPAGSPGVTHVIVTNSEVASQPTDASEFSYTAFLGQPFVDSISPDHGPESGGNRIILHGGNFSYGEFNRVEFDGIAGSDYIVDNEAGNLVVTPPPGHGTVHVIVYTDFDGFSLPTAGSRYTYEPPGEPSLASSDPAVGLDAGGTVVSIHGIDLGTTSAVTFGGVPATSFSIVSNTELTAVAPPGTFGATVDIAVTTAFGTATLPAAFTYHKPPPTITSISPGYGPAQTNVETTVTITGTNFYNVSAVAFGDQNGAVVSYTPTGITAKAPWRTDPGPRAVTVTADGGQNDPSAAAVFTYVPAGNPVVTGVSAASGSRSGGESVVITGTGFTGATRVTFSDDDSTNLDATSFTADSDTQVTAVSPPHAPGPVYVRVWNLTQVTPETVDSLYTYLPDIPAITGVSPSSGLDLGGYPIQLAGTHFLGATQVLFGTTPAPGFGVGSDTAMGVTVPPGVAGTVDIRVLGPDGTSAIVDHDQFTYIQGPQPVISAINPSAGPEAGGGYVTITGSNLTGGSGLDFVKFGGVPSPDASVNSGTVIAKVPPGVGIVDVIVKNNGYESVPNADSKYTYTPTDTPSVSEVTPASGSTHGGDSITINGLHLGTTTGVTIGGAAMTRLIVTDTSVSGTTPPGSAGAADVVLATAAGPVTVGGGFTYVRPPPVITSVSPATGTVNGGILVTIKGNEMTGASTATVGGQALTGMVVDNDGQIRGVLPAGSAGPADVVVTTLGGTSTSGSHAFTYVATAAPVVTVISPSSGSTAGDTAITVTGSGFAGATSVSVGGHELADISVTDTTITGKTPTGAAGSTHVLVTTPGGTSQSDVDSAFTYVAPMPAVSGISPDHGPESGGTDVVVTGSGFTGATGISFGGVPGTGLVVVNDTQVRAASPAGTGAADIRVTTAGGTSPSGTASFTYDAAPPPALPVVDSISPAGGPEAGDTEVTLTGSGFTGATLVSFGGVAGTALSIDSDTQLRVTSPPGSAGAPVHVTVTTGNGTSTAGPDDLFTYTTAPAGPPQASIDAQTVQNMLAPLAAGASAGAIQDAVNKGISIALSSGASLDLGTNGGFLAYADALPDPTGGAFAGVLRSGRDQVETGPWSIWLDVKGGGLLDLANLGSDQRGLQVNLTGGIGYRPAPNVVLGGLAGFEDFAYRADAPAGTLAGSGKSVGFYAGWKPSDTMLVDLSIVWSGIHYRAESGAASGEFDAARWLVTGGLSGSFDLDGTTVEPSARLYALWEDEAPWTDSLSTAHPERSFVNGRLSLGGTISRALPISDGWQAVPSIGAYLDIGTDQDTAPAQEGGQASGTTWSGRVTTGLDLQSPGGLGASVSGELSGLGSDHPAWSIRANVNADF